MENVGYGKCDLCNDKGARTRHLGLNLCPSCIKGIAKGFEKK